MSNRNICWKIKDNATGLFWGGSVVRCSDAVGTRFERRASIDDTVRNIIKKDGSFPETWSVVEVELSETERWSLSGKEVAIDAIIGPRIETVLTKRLTEASEFHPSWHQIKAGVILVRSYWNDRKNNPWHFMGCRAEKMPKNRGSFKKALLEYGVTEDQFKTHTNGWATFADESVAMTAKMIDAVGVVCDIQTVLLDFARKNNFQPEDVLP